MSKSSCSKYSHRRATANRTRDRRRRMLESLEPRCLLASLGGEVFIDTNGDGIRNDAEVGAADVRVYVDANNDGQFAIGELFTSTDENGQYQFESLGAGDYNIRVLADAADQTSPRAYLGTGYLTTFEGEGPAPTQLFEMSESGDVVTIGTPSTTRMHGLVRTNDGMLVGINFNSDAIYSIDPLTGQESLLAETGKETVAGLAYDAETDTIYTLIRESGALRLKTVDAETGALRTPVASTAALRGMGGGSTFYDIDTATKTATEITRGFLSPFASTLDVRSDGVIFGLQGNDIKQFAFDNSESSGVTVSTLSTSIDAISFGADDNLFGVSSPSTFHSIDLATGVVDAGIPIQYQGRTISGIQGFDIGPDGTHYMVDPSHLYTFDPQTGIANRAPNRGFPSSPIFTSLTVANDGSLFASFFSSTIQIGSVDPVTGKATDLGIVGGSTSYYPSLVATGIPSDGAATIDLANVSDLTFDPVRDRIVGFDNNSDRFFQFTTDGVGTILGTASRPLDSWSLAFNGTDFVMFDQGDDARTSVIKVDPETGAISDGFQASSRTPAESLFYTTRGNNPHRLTVGDTDLVSVDFGITRVKPTRDVETDYPTVISELVLDPLFASRDTDQLVELRGLPGGQLPSNTYLVVVSEDDNTQGQIQEIFDLSNQSLGANGYLVLSQFDSPHAIAAGSAVLTSTGNGFAGLPNGIYSDIDTNDGRIGGTLIGQNGFFLIRSEIAPGIGDDIDLDDDGLADPDGVKSNWTVLDSVSAHTFVGNGEQAYGQILLAEQELSEDPTLRTVEPGTPIVVSNGSGYVARVGESVGSSPDDWIIGTAVESSGDSSGDLLELYGFGPHLPESMFFLERSLDHFGEANFVGGVRGTILQTSPLDPANPDATVLPPSPAVGYTILADENGNGIQDTISRSADPNVIVNQILADVGFNPNFVLPTIPLTHAFPGVTISTAGDDNEPINFEVQAVRERNSFITSNNFIYSHVGIDFFSEIRKLRFEFDRPASEVSIVAIGAQNSNNPVYGKLEAYNSNDELIGEITSRPVIGANRQTITVAADDIAYAIAYGSTEVTGSSPFGRLDGFTYKQSEATAVTDENGKYEIKRLFPGEYDIVVQSDPDNPLLGLSSTPIVIDKYENFVVGSNVRPNSIPVVEAEYAITTNENPAIGTSLGTVPATELDGQALTFAILGDNTIGVLIDSTTGELTVGPDTVLDFEASPEVTFDVAITDPFITVITRVTISLTNINEAPVVDQAMFLVTEGTPAGTSLGQVTATDPEGGLGQTISFAIVGGPDQNAFTIDPVSGLVTLVDADAVDFEVAQQLRFVVRVSDDADPAASTEYEQVIQVADQNDPPTIATTEIVTDENPATRLIGQLVASDPDADQTHTFQLLGGTGADLFRVSQSGEVILREGVSIDFEQGNSYTLRVRTIDSGAPPLAAESTITVTINNVDELPVLTTTSATVAEDAVAGDVVATLTSSDPDGAEIATEIALLEGSDAANFAFDPATGILTIAEAANLDFETKPTQTVHFRVTTTGSDTSNIVTYRINLTDANDHPIITTERIVVSELAVPGTLVGRIQVSDPDPNDVATLAVVGGNAADRFTLDSATGFLRVAEEATFDADVESEPLTIEIQVTDGAGLSSTRVINIIVNGVNEAPTFSSDPPASTTLESGVFYEFVIPEGAISDPEGREFFVSVFDQSGRLPSWLNFNPATRTLSGYATPNSVGTHNLTLRAFEPGPLELKTDQTFALTVNAGADALTNKRDRLDVDANNLVSPVDALRIINFLSRYGNNASVSVPRLFSGFVDTSGDGFVTAFDALLVINGLKQIPGNAASGEQFGLPTDDSDDTNDAALTEYLTESSLF
ncbi:cadherin domain-containing protein [Rubripirellula reticaptiva]|uniref:Cadherin domain protein n=1 Tax=Rubripirellula reticaptiva TaxID=2528013 RepID=A0A5C6F862_9BACT|nr:cadherin domain-containing protein [Rubripirellula reticaptiva]TWU57923.1 Cadherin domain protein [Rubripirellula reticaptiva]